MDPVSIGLGLASVGLSLFGANKQNKGNQQQIAAAKVSAAAGADIAQQEINEDQVRRTGMELSAHRSNMEDLRSAQKSRSMALTAASGSGASVTGGSALGGAYGGISGQLNTGLTGISNNLEMGRRMFDLNTQINQDRITQANAGVMSAEGQATAAQGKTIAGLAGPLSSLAGAAKGVGSSLSGFFSDTTGGMQSTFDEMSASTRSS